MAQEIIRPSKGLAGVVYDETSISKAMPDKCALIYRGYPVHDLANKCSFEEVAYLLLNDELPNSSQLESFTAQERAGREVSARTLQAVELFPSSAHPMDSIRTGVSFLGMEDPEAWNNEPEDLYRKSLSLLSKIPTIVAARRRFTKGLRPVPPRPDLNFSENFFHMCFEKVPEADVVKAFDASMTLYAEHGFNASSFTARVVASSLSEIYAAVTAAIGSLKGPLHGGANEAVMHMLKNVGEVSRAKAWMMDALEQKRKIMGFGHRLYYKGDSRVPTMSSYRDKIAEITGESQWVEISRVLESTMIEEKNIYPNLDFPAGPTYYMMGFDIEMFTPIFVLSRITGWAAHVMEQLANNRLVRPLSDYTGPEERPIAALRERS